MSDETFRILLDGGESVTAVRSAPGQDSARWTFIYAPGAGSNLHDPFGRRLGRELPGRGIEVVRFQFPYAEARRRFPDRPPILEATWKAAMEQCRSADRRLVVGGRSMGGRIASQAVAQGAKVDALVLFAYPLHPPGQPANLRTQHLPRIAAPTMFISGNQDEFGTPDELAGAAGMVPEARLHLLEGANHGFGPARGVERTKEQIESEAIDTAVEFLQSLPVAA